MGKPPVRILLVDNFNYFRSFAGALLRSQRGYEIVGEAQDGLEAVELATKLQPDLILLDVSLPKLTGIDAARQIRPACAASKILFLSADTAPELARKAMSEGALGYVLKWQAGHDLLPAVKAVLQGKQFVSSFRGSNLAPEDES